MSVQVIQAARRIINEAIPVLEQKYQKSLPELRHLQIKTSANMTRTFGNASSRIDKRTRAKVYIVKFSTVVYNPSNVQTSAFRNTVIHELAHVAETLIYGRRMSHSEDWANIMRVCGETPSKFVQKEKKEELNFVSAPRRKMKKYAHKCSAGCTHLLSGQKHNRLMAGAVYTCRKTGTLVQREYEVVR